ncbi:RimK family alpha-L-glutamate ligase [Natranaeroarchaeum sulfidigenes]|uniref:Glutathione synthase/glutaminyl transferase/alpha-L-glutamate ligase n=1 Tax=Natranaeroarchaeum sulfidigenes TaxID=2784880 RepID=A0A897MLS4_9EURY|nr:RimK family alpha-L-glutamate ligase [Natranaeroarchaeum sulfidigenes]QSG03150.1 Glutathione synthase/glutaminyl transferase/alpha-L-glutamate ligase [Natranaeroarchaeum sulfidigenes]
MNDDLTVGVLSLHNSKETKAILNAVDDLGYGTEWLRAENTSVSIDGGAVSIEPDVDVVTNRLLLSNTPQPCEELGIANVFEGTRPMLNTPEATMTAMHKFAAATTLADAGVPVPDALLALGSDTLTRRREEFGSEAVYKTSIGTHGGGTWKVGPDEAVNAMVGNRYAFLQDLIERDGEKHRDLRVYVVGDDLIGAMHRYAPDGDWRTNVSLGGDVRDATEQLTDEIRDIVRDATDAIGLDYAGVDLIEGEDGWYVLEVNPTAGFKGFFEATGTSPAPYIAKLAIERAGGTIDDDLVKSIARTLDDSVPAARPQPSHTSEQEIVPIGYTEEVLVSGTSDSKTVYAKSDTGATRTSIDTSLAAEIGAGPIKSKMRVKSGSSKRSKVRPIVDIVVGVGGRRHTVAANVEDRSHMEYPLLLGRDILEHYHVDVARRADAEDDEVELEE